MVVANFSEKKDTIIVGAGPGGYVAAIRAAQRGQEVTLIEKEFIGGICLNVGCIPSKSLVSFSKRYQEMQTDQTEILGLKTGPVEIDWKKTQEWKQKEVVDPMIDGVKMLLEKNGVEVVRGSAYFNGRNTVHVDGENPITYSFNNLIIATGSSPIELEGFKFSKRVIDSTGVLSLESIPSSIIFIGGGVTACELGGVYSRLGSKVTILEKADHILPSFPKDMGRLVKNHFVNEGTEVLTQIEVIEAVEEEDRVRLRFVRDGKEEEIQADYVAVTAGRRPNTSDLGIEKLGVELDDEGYVVIDDQCRTTNENVYAIGDIVPGVNLAHKASHEAKVAAGAISGEATALDYRSLPLVAFTQPEVARTGMSKKEAEEKGLKVRNTKFLYNANGRAKSMNAAEGFVRLITTKDDHVLVGAEIVGSDATDLISELSLAIESGMNAEDLALTIHPHPTLSEMIMDAAEDALGQAIHQ